MRVTTIKKTSFDVWYDNKVNDIIKRLPCPYSFSNPTIEYPIVFSEFENCYIAEDINFEDICRTKTHTIRFKKIWINGVMKWDRI